MTILVIIILLLSFFLSSYTFLGDAFIKLYETLQEYHMPCEIAPLRVDLFQNGSFFVSVATAAKLVQPIPIFFLAYLVPLDVEVAPIKFHQFLFGE
jgi:hypothetical protein